MKFEETIIAKKANLNNAKTYDSISIANGLTLCDPITQICKRIEAFFKADPEITCRYAVNNNKHLGPKVDPDTGEQMTKKMDIDGELVDVLLEEDHFCEFRIFVENVEKAQCLANVIRHRHTIPETFEGSDGQLHARNHYLIVRVCTVDAVDPDGEGGGENPWISDDDTDKGVKEIFGLEPINWDDMDGYGCNERLAPSDTSESDIPKGVPEEYEQKQWEQNPGSSAWKWSWFKNALKGNKNIMDTTYEFFDGMNTWRFVECSRIPVVFLEDNLTSTRGFNSILPADLLPLIFSVFGGYQISTYARKEML